MDIKLDPRQLEEARRVGKICRQIGDNIHDKYRRGPWGNVARAPTRLGRCVLESTLLVMTIMFRILILI